MFRKGSGNDIYPVQHLEHLIRHPTKICQLSWVSKKWKKKNPTSHLKQNFLPALTMSFNQHNLCYVAIFSKFNMICNSYIDISRKLNDNFFFLACFQRITVTPNLSNTEVTFNYFHFLNKKKKEKKEKNIGVMLKRKRCKTIFWNVSGSLVLLQFRILRIQKLQFGK